VPLDDVLPCVLALCPEGAAKADPALAVEALEEGLSVLDAPQRGRRSGRRRAGGGEPPGAGPAVGSLPDVRRSFARSSFFCFSFCFVPVAYILLYLEDIHQIH
jgi:hypothetical protein